VEIVQKHQEGVAERPTREVLIDEKGFDTWSNPKGSKENGDTREKN